MVEVILNTEVTESQETATESFMGRFAYATTALTAMSTWLAENGDDEGSAKLLAFAVEFAKHEAETV